MKRLLALLMALAMIFALAACGNEAASAPASEASGPEEASAPAPAADAAGGAVYYLNFKPEQNDAWQELAKAYTAETGVPVTVVTAASGTYEETLMSEMAKSEPPTLFQVNGPVGLANRFH